jgi:hypothetical protein
MLLLMFEMPQPTNRKRREVYDQDSLKRVLDALLDSWLELDRRVVEISMQRYKIAVYAAAA